MKKLLFVAAFAVICFMFATANGYTKSLYEIADSNKDGIVTENEMQEAVAQRYKDEDANKDARLTVDEYQAARQKNFDDADTKKDGVVTVEQWAVYWCGAAKGADKVKKPVKMGRKASRPKLMDKNKDGKLSQDECVLFWAGRFIDLDADHDGKLTREEYLGKMKDMAKTMDINGDGVIVIEEYNISWLGKKK
ncbi:MAG: EF-hand domain-containing protein [Syntrophorhabdaceae bacterium]